MIRWLIVASICVFMAPRWAWEHVYGWYQAGKIARQLGPDATPFQYGYASAPYLVKQMGQNELVRVLFHKATRGQFTEFDAGLVEWLREHLQVEM